MAIKTLNILSKETATPLEISAVVRRLSDPIVIQPEYTFDPSDMFGFFVPEVSFNDTDFYWNTSHYLSVSTGFANGVYVKEASLGPDFQWVAGLLDVSITTTEASVNLLWQWNIRQEASLGNINSSLGVLNIWNINQDTSIGILNNWNISQDSSVININSSIGILNNWNVSQDASIDFIANNYVKESSLGTDFKWDYISGSTGPINLDVSTINISFLYYVKDEIDASFYTKAAVDASFWLKTNLFLRESSLGADFYWAGGTLEVSTHYPDNFSELGDVSIVNIAENNALMYVTGKWTNVETIEEASIYYTKTEIDSSFYTKAQIDASKQNILYGCDTSTSNEIRFDKIDGHIYGNIYSPLSGALTTNLTGALKGVTSLAIHLDNSTGVSLPTTFKKLSGTYAPNVNNYIYVQYIDASNQLYVIHHTV